LLNIIVLISGNGSNLQAIIDNSKSINVNIMAVISNKANAYGLQRAKKANIPTIIIEHTNLSREEFDRKLVLSIKQYNPDLIVLAGFMRLLTNYFIESFPNKIINIHPSLLPKFKGLNTHQRVIDAKEKQHGATVHFVNSQLDAGKIIKQTQVEVRENDTAESLANRVLEKEHILFSEVLKDFANAKNN